MKKFHTPHQAINHIGAFKTNYRRHTKEKKCRKAKQQQKNHKKTGKINNFFNFSNSRINFQFFFLSYSHAQRRHTCELPEPLAQTL